MSELIMAEGATPSTPSTGKVKIFPPTQTIPTLAVLDDAGLLGKIEWDGAGTLRYKPPTIWTPGISFGGGVTGITYSGQVGYYERIGSRIFFSGYVALSNKGSSTGAANITGLPVASKNVASYFHTPTIRADTMSSITGMVQALIAPNSSVISMTFLGTGAATVVDNTHFQNTTVLIVSGHYEV